VENFKWTAACLGALIGGGVIWALESYVFTGGTPGILRDLIDWLAPVAGALIFGVLAGRGVLPGQHNGHHDKPGAGGTPPPAPDASAGLPRRRAHPLGAPDVGLAHVGAAG
jgi:hypothetical protein